MQKAFTLFTDWRTMKFQVFVLKVENMLIIQIYDTVKPPISDYPKCQDQVVACARLSLIRGQTIESLTVASLA